jgi:hypothetical protein
MTIGATTMARAAAHLVLWVALVLQGLGVSRALVVCNGAHCENRVQFRHASGSCCDHAVAAATSARAPAHGSSHAGCCHDDCGGAAGERMAPQCGRCVDTPLAVADEFPPHKGDRFGDDAALPAAAPQRTVIARDEGEAVALPPATGPPRADRRTELLATTVLRL